MYNVDMSGTEVKMADTVGSNDFNAALNEGEVNGTGELSPPNPERDPGGMQERSGQRQAHDLVYALEDMPPWYTTLVLGLQVRGQLIGPTPHNSDAS